MKKCPHCGNTNPDLIESNANSYEQTKDESYTLLCIARVKPEESSYSYLTDEDTGPDGLVPCGMQWYPNQPRD